MSAVWRKKKPERVWKVGLSLWTLHVDEETGKCEMEEYIIRTIRGGFVYAVWKIVGVTWGKRSTKHGDFGFLKQIPAWTRERWRVDGACSYSLHTTKVSAIKHELLKLDIDDFDNPEMFEKTVRTLNSMLTREKNKKKGKVVAPAKA